jgi:pimeloyl-ACP methyl ester carboxylesterase
MQNIQAISDVTDGPLLRTDQHQHWRIEHEHAEQHGCRRPDDDRNGDIRRGACRQTTPPKAKNVVLVHGAYADGSSWSEVIPLLQEAGLHVTSVQIPLTSFADDVAATRRALALQDGPTVLVGHS